MALTGEPAPDPDLYRDPDRAVTLCREAHARLLATLSGLTDDQARSPSRLPGWSVGHVVTHLARNADGHARRVGGARVGEDLVRYPGGRAQRGRDIERGAGRPAAELMADLTASQDRLETVFADSVAAGWPHPDLRADDHYPVTGCPAHRLREVEMHHVDLGLGYEPTDWPDDYVAWDLPQLLATVPGRLASAGDRRRFLAWLAGRGPEAGGVALDPW